MNEEWLTVDDMIKWMEADPVRATYLREARKRLAPHLYQLGDPGYERMMRGEGPPPNVEQQEGG